jgi:hypothetical protein
MRRTLNTGKFSEDVHKFNKKTQKKIENGIGEIAHNLWLDLERNWNQHVWTGWLRTSFRLTVNAPATDLGPPDQRPGGRGGKKPEDPLEYAPDPGVPEVKIGDKVYITNLVPYIGFVENKYGITKACMQRATRNAAKTVRDAGK